MKLQEELPELDDPLRVGPPVWYLGRAEYAKRCAESRIDTSFRARKSLFAFDGMMLMLGSAIRASDSAPVATTLFQNSLEKLDKTKFQAGKGFFIVFLHFYLLCIRLDDAKLTQGYMGGILLSILLV